MLSEFLKFFDSENIALTNCHFLLGVSSGKDSMCMLHLFMASGAQISVAHLNYNLRGEHSIGDQEFISKFCKEKSIAFYTKNAFKSIESKNTQNWARDLRYQFFDELGKKIKADFICTAHHKQDNIESFMFNLFRGSGLKGLSGIAQKRNKILRPLLNFKKDEIDQFVKDKNILFRIDESNLQLDYDRNKIRHKILPTVNEVFPNAFENISTAISNINDSNLLLNNFISNWKEKNCVENEASLKIPISALNRLKGKRSLLFEILSPYNFNRSQIRSILDSLGKSGLFQESSNATLRMEREELILFKTSQPKECEIVITVMEVHEVQFNKDAFQEYIDGDKMSPPLEIRKVAEGEKMQPLGMNGQSKKISDIAIDLKMSYEEKQNLRIAVSNEIPVWLIGHVLDHRFKIDSSTKKILSLRTKSIKS